MITINETEVYISYYNSPSSFINQSKPLIIGANLCYNTTAIVSKANIVLAVLIEFLPRYK